MNIGVSNTKTAGSGVILLLCAMYKVWGVSYIMDHIKSNIIDTLLGVVKLISKLIPLNLKQNRIKYVSIASNA